PVGATLFAAAFLLSSMALTTQRSVAEITASIGQGAGRALRFGFVRVPLVAARCTALLYRAVSRGAVVLGHALFLRRAPAPRPKEEIPLPQPRIRRNSLRRDEDAKGTDLPAADSLAAGDPAIPGEPSFVVVQRKSDEARVSERELKKIW